MSNSKLVNHTKISPCRTSPRNHAIDTITIHCVVGQCAVETLGVLFSNRAYGASSNYGVGYDGKIGQYVDERDRSWCTSSAANDNRAITIEVASDQTEPYAVNDKAYNALISLVADICKRNGIKELIWSTDKTKRINHTGGVNLTVHRDYTTKSCPGDYLYGRMGDIAAKVNAQIKGSTATTTTATTTKPAASTTATTTTKPASSVPYIVKVTASALNVRRAPGTSAQIVKTIQRGGAYTIIEEVKAAGSAKGWGLLKAYEATRSGWVSLDYVSKI